MTQQLPKPGSAARSFGTIGIVALVAGFASHHDWLTTLGLISAFSGAMAFVFIDARGLLTRLVSPRSGIGMGASVASDAVIEPGATVEMGASIGRGAVIKAGARVRMGASVGKGAVIESGAIVSWGADVGRDARVGENAVVGAGASVKRGALVPAGTRLLPGTEYGGKGGLPTIPAKAPVPPPDPREQRTAAVCEKLEAELKASPEMVRDFLGGAGQTVSSLRRTCEDLLARERALRGEIDESAAASLEEERAAVQKRADAATDDQIRMSLLGALAAMDELKRQRDLLRVGADRLQAEHTRLLYTLEALASQFVRLRTTGREPGTRSELEKSVQQLRGELEAITDALEQVSLAAHAVPPPREDELNQRDPQREKTR